MKSKTIEIKAKINKALKIPFAIIFEVIINYNLSKNKKNSSLSNEF
ncbi:hypothetical protein GCM10011343_13720 [Flavobacterium orientale]|uniref:Uncharacterized protein n=1 Tax=Flavobacterium orientale TaxID=1756020 RepID=A0A916Y024_9FLAO|nr:hypothetical protein GCM10011343_13720 [Flavobacterium orientale]